MSGNNTFETSDLEELQMLLIGYLIHDLIESVAISRMSLIATVSQSIHNFKKTA